MATPATPDQFCGWEDGYASATENESEHPDLDDGKASIDAMSVRDDEDCPEKFCNLNNN